MKSKSKNIFGCMFFLLIISSLGTSLLLVFSLIARKVESHFGPPTDQLDRSQQILYTMRLFLKTDQLVEYRTKEETEMVFTVDEGEPPASITHRMRESNLISDTSSFIDLLIYSGFDRKIQPGVYRIEPEMNSVALANMLVNPNPQFVAFSFLAGWRWEEIANLLPGSGLEIDTGDFQDALQRSKIPFQNPEGYEMFGSEGYLSPGDYLISRSATADEIVQIFIDRFMETLPDHFEKKAITLQLSPHEVVILASIVQKEMILSEEASLIASVFLNRLRENMPLQSDPTVQYALGYDEVEKTWWKTKLSTEDLGIESQFNTYLKDGLPTTPICNPGLDAIQAVLRPEETNYLYFRAACDESGRHLFSETYGEHLENACED
jgi:UPF0755 protein